ncbi:MAG: class I adenylate cyclase [Gammaproteobacteria bacterium]|nr:class I adenylate cyclase [Gammaproteobacteria bacterium]
MAGGRVLHDINSIKKRFLALNRDRLNRTRDTLRPRQREVMDLLPLLFHYNHPTFPGFVSKETPAGISEYTPSSRELDACKSLVPSFDFRSRALARYDLQALFLMGSCGSIAFSSDSDFDIWLCHRSDLNEKQLAELQGKATAIENWAATYNLEVHFFLMDAEKFRSGQNVELSSESSGSAQHFLLLDEFYRTSILFAGRYPLWWLVPPDMEGDYQLYTRNLLEKRFIRDGEVIDFGTIPEAPVQEFFGAALWQLYKSIDSPYKAVLKLMLMEAYASEFPRTQMLCSIFKKHIYAGETDLLKLDAYMILYRKIEDYLNQGNDNIRLNLVRQAFYFKSNQNLGLTTLSGRSTWQQEMMLTVVRSWGWNDGQLMTLDSRPKWKILRVTDERNNLINALTQCYRFLSNFARMTVRLSDINQNDLNILGRRLYSAFERKAGKIELINRGISDDIHETHLTFHQISKTGHDSWSLYQGAVFSDQLSATKPLKRSRSLVELIAWCFLNKLFDDRTSIAVFSRDDALNSNDLKAIIRVLSKVFPGGNSISVSSTDLLEPPRTLNSTAFINVGCEPSSQLLINGMQMTSNRVDALCYSGICQNLVYSIDQVSQNSWQEVMSHHFEGEHGTIDYISTVLQASPPGTDARPPEISVSCFTPGRGMSITQRINELYRDITKCYYGGKHPITTRYILSIARNYYALYFDDGILKYKVFSSLSTLTTFLAQPMDEFSPVVIDRNAINLQLLPLVYSHNKPGQIQFFYQAQDSDIDCLVLDEHGSLFTQRISGVNDQIVIRHFKRFLDSVLYRQHIETVESKQMMAGKHQTKPVLFYQIGRGQDGRLVAARQTLHEQPREQAGYVELQVITDANEQGVKIYTIYHENQEYSSLEFGDKVFEEVARSVLQRRVGSSIYPIYITDLDLSRNAVGKQRGEYLQTQFYLLNKREIEERFAQALAAMSQGNQSARA